MNRAELKTVPAYYERYILLNEADNLLDALKASMQQLQHADLQNWERLGRQVYAPGKWTLHDILQHLIDTERIMSYRALRFARQDACLLPSFDENAYAAHANAVNRSLQDLISELQDVRRTTIDLFQSFTPGMLQCEGALQLGHISVGAIGFMIAGHQMHHINIINERYIPLLQAEAI
jgi:hypothetical protein